MRATSTGDGAGGAGRAGVPRREDLAALRPVGRVAGRNVTKADILVFELHGRAVAVKDYAGRPWPLRQTLGRWLVRRECAAYVAAAGAPGLVPFLGRIDAFALATVWIDARPLATLEPTQLPPGVAAVLGRIVDGLHRRGVALGDLHHRDVLLGSDQRVHVVDLATAWVAPPDAGWLRRKLFERFRDADRVALVRLDARLDGRDPDDAVARMGGSAARWHRLGRRLKRGFDRLRGRRRRTRA
jgi:hypothetical protein